MIEIPEARILATQIEETLEGREISQVVANQSPHKFAWFDGEPKAYPDRLIGLTVSGATSHGGFVVIDLGPRILVFAEGPALRYHSGSADLPKKHQLLVGFDDGSHLSVSVQMYGGLWCWEVDAFDNEYYLAALDKPSPLSDGFTEAYLDELICAPEVQHLSTKALLATEQRIPGLGNGVLQDILFNAGIHPKRKVDTLDSRQRKKLHRAVRRVLAEMVAGGGRNTEKSLFGEPGGYVTKLSRYTFGKPCPNCASIIQKANYMGGSVYFCSVCQPT